MAPSVQEEEEEALVVGEGRGGRMRGQVQRRGEIGKGKEREGLKRGSPAATGRAGSCEQATPSLLR